MKIANLDHRLVLVNGLDAIDVERASDGRFSADAQAIYSRWAEFCEWARSVGTPAPDARIETAALHSPVPRPRQIFAIGTNFRDHAAEVGLTPTAHPTVFTKFRSSISGPESVVTLPENGSTDWEIELAVVIAEGGRQIPLERAWDCVAGLTASQDFSERSLQTAASPPQFSLGKSFAGFLPMGPVLVTPDEFADRDDIRLSTKVNGAVVQSGTTADMILSVAELIHYLSGVVELLAGDVILTGTPAGVGAGLKPPRFLQPSDVVIGEIEGIGQLRQVFVAADASVLA